MTATETTPAPLVIEEPPRSADSRPLAPAGPPSRRERTGVAALLVGTAVLYLWGLGASGYANDFYAAAVQAGTKSWKAFFFGSLDSANAITVDKPPASLWPMELSGRIFGFSSWSMLVPQGIMGVLAVWLLYATVRRWFGPGAALLAGVLLAITPVAVLMFRFNNPDALMTLLIVVAAYCTTRALENASTKWLLPPARRQVSRSWRRDYSRSRCFPHWRWPTSWPHPRPCGVGCCSCSARGRRSWSRPDGGSSPSI